MEKKHIRETSIDAKLLYQRLRKAEIGEFIPYSELSEIIGQDVQKKGRGFLTTARRMCEREDKKTFGVVINEGLKLLDNGEIIGTAEFSVRHIKRTSRRSIKRLSCIEDLSTLENGEKIRFNTFASILGVMATMGQERSIRKIQNKVQETQERLPYAKTLEAFK